MTISRTLQKCVWLACVGLVTVGAAQAQSVYRIVGPDGKVTFSDRPPETAAPGSRNSEARAAGGSSEASELPYALRQVAQRFPVTLYTGDNCAPCDTARNLLVQRGIPFTERTVNTNADIEALQRLSGTSNLPFGTIGGQQLVGFSQAEWDQYLNAAGYPKQSSLPANFRRSAATPLVAIKPVEAVPRAATAPAAAARARTAPAATAPTGPTPSNPAGIKF